MNRRTLIKTLGLSAVGIATVPLWMDSWTAESLPVVGFQLNENQQETLGALVNVIIPATKTPGAKDLQIDKFIITMVGDCYEKHIQDRFLAGFKAMEEASKEKYGKAFPELSEEEKPEFLLQMLNQPVTPENDFNFVAFVKGLTVSGYMTSEFYLTQIVKHEFVPSRFNGSFPVEESVYKTI